jgi:hypothetical protein
MVRWFVAAACVVAAPLEAQLSTVPVGARVRVLAPPALPRPVVATLSNVWTDSIALSFRAPAAAGDSILVRRSLVLTLSPIHRVDVSAGRDHGVGAREGARTGLIVGGSLGLLVLGFTYIGSKDDTDGCLAICDRSSQIRLGWAIAGGLTAAGTIAGSVFGGVVGAERWRRVYP